MLAYEVEQRKAWINYFESYFSDMNEDLKYKKVIKQYKSKIKIINQSNINSSTENYEQLRKCTQLFLQQQQDQETVQFFDSQVISPDNSQIFNENQSLEKQKLLPNETNLLPEKQIIKVEQKEIENQLPREIEEEKKEKQNSDSNIEPIIKQEISSNQVNEKSDITLITNQNEQFSDERKMNGVLRKSQSLNSESQIREKKEKQFDFFCKISIALLKIHENSQQFYFDKQWKHMVQTFQQLLSENNQQEVNQKFKEKIISEYKRIIKKKPTGIGKRFLSILCCSPKEVDSIEEIFNKSTNIQKMYEFEREINKIQNYFQNYSKKDGLIIKYYINKSKNLIKGDFHGEIEEYENLLTKNENELEQINESCQMQNVDK